MMSREGNTQIELFSLFLSLLYRFESIILIRKIIHTASVSNRFIGQSSAITRTLRLRHSG